MSPVTPTPAAPTADPANVSRPRKPKTPAPLDLSGRSLSAVVTTLKLISDETRLKILAILSHGEKNVGQLCTEIGQSQPAISHHLALLRVSRLAEAKRIGKNVYYELTEAGWKAVEACR
jgi:ArsR family transcriptional regulator